MIIVKVILPIPIRQSFEYFIPDCMCPVIGGRILVPFKSKDIIGIVIDFYKKHDISQLKFKYAKLLIDNKSLYTNILFDLLMWISHNYYCPIGNLFFSVLPKILNSDYVIKEKYVCEWRITKKGQELDLNYLRKSKKQLNTLVFLKENNILSTELKKYNLSKFILKQLESQKLCKIHCKYKRFEQKKKL